MSYTQKLITATNKGPLVQVLTLMFLVLAVLSCIVRTGTKIHMIKTLKADDLLAILATLLAVAQSSIIYIGSEHGVGQHFDALTAGNIATFYKTQYAANALFVASQVCAKVSGTMALRMMSRRSQKWVILGCEIVVGLWGLSALIASLFQCKLPTPWDYSDEQQCIHQPAFWTYYSIANIVTDVAIVGIMVENARRIQTSWGKKILVIGVFGSRILVTPAICAQIYYTNKAFASDDATFPLWKATISIQLVQCLAIFTICVPSLKPFLDSLESGQIRMDDLRRQGKSSSNGYPTYHPGQSRTKSHGNHSLASWSGPHRTGPEDVLKSSSQRSEVHELVELGKTSKRRDGGVTPDGNKGSWDGQSHSSHSSQKILIQQTWQVEVESMRGKGKGSE